MVILAILPWANGQELASPPRLCSYRPLRQKKSSVLCKAIRTLCSSCTAPGVLIVSLIVRIDTYQGVRHFYSRVYLPNWSTSQQTNHGDVHLLLSSDRIPFGLTRNKISTLTHHPSPFPISRRFDIDRLVKEEGILDGSCSRVGRFWVCWERLC